MGESETVATPPGRKAWGFRTWRRWAPRAVFECVLIVFSVALALALTNWAEDRKTAHRVDEMRTYLIAEIRANRAMLTDPYYIAHHERLKRTFAGALDSPEGAAAQARPAATQLFRTGLHQPTPRDAVWTSVSHGDLLEHMEMDEILALARVYRTQESLEGINRAGYENALGLLDLLTDDAGDPRRPMMRMTLYLEDLLAVERNLIALYDEALAELGAAPEAPARPAATRTDDAAPAKR